MKRLWRLGAAALIAAIAAGVANAQAPQPSAPAPQRTTATFEDWTLRCETQGNPPVKNCELVQAVTAPGQTQPVTQVAIGRATPKDPLKVVFQLPVNVWLPTGVSFLIDAKAQALSATMRWCNPAGCFADLDLANDHVKRMRGATAQGRFTFKDATRRDINIPVSFKGFGNALDALGKQ